MSQQDKDPVNLIITGVGGQGNILMSRLIGETLVGDGRFVTIGEIYGLSQRGGSVASHMRIARDEMYSPLTPIGCADVILGLEPLESLRMATRFGYHDTVVVSNTRPIYPLSAAIGEAEYPTLEEIKQSLGRISKRAWFIRASDIAIELGAPLLTNIVMTGALVAMDLLPLRKDMLEEQLRMNFKKEKLALNMKAFQKGFDEMDAQLSKERN
jgi:indolepyruvate ferredoxin oxidoreductase beta subunit